MLDHTLKSQHGHAALLFCMMIPILFGVFTLGSDGARMLQEKARMDEAVEVASLAVSAADASNDISSLKTIAKDYIAYFFPVGTITDDNVTVTKVACEVSSTTCPIEADEERYHEYTVSAVLKEENWFSGSSSTSPSFDKIFQLAGSSISRKYQSEALDVIYVADFSGSMSSVLRSATGSDVGVAKYVILKNIIIDVNNTLKEFNSHLSTGDSKAKVGFAGYNHWAHKTSSCGVDYIKYTSNGTSVSFSATNNYGSIFNSAVGCKNIADIYAGRFNDIALTASFTDFSSAIASFAPYLNYGQTNSVQGLISGARLANDGTNRRKLLIILSDGVDYPESITTNRLYNDGLCNTIRNGLNNKKTTDDKYVESRIVMIGFDYDPTGNPGLSTCVGGTSSGNIFRANNSEELKTTILTLINEEIGRLAN
jgi:tight adherence protein G